MIEEIKEIEERLRKAMLNSDIEELNKLISPNLIFTTHMGRVISKEDDINAHTNGIVKITNLDIYDLKINFFNDVAVVTLQANISGLFGGQPSEGKFRFTRIWSKNNNKNWQIEAGHSSLIS